MVIRNGLRIVCHNLFDGFPQCPFVTDRSQTVVCHVLFRVYILLEDNLEYFLGNGGVDGSLICQFDQLSQMVRRKPDVLRFHFLFLQKTHGLHHEPVGYFFRIMADFHGLLKDVCHLFACREDGNIIIRNIEFFFVSCRFCFLELRLSRFHLLNPLITNDNWCQIRIREITVILGVLLGTHRIGIFLVVIPSSRFLNDFLAILQELNLTGTLSLNGAGDGFKRVQVFHLGTGAKFTGSHLTNRQVHIRTHGALIEFAVRGLQILNGSAEFFQIRNDFIGTSHIRLRDNLNQWHTGTVVIHQGTICPVIMDKLSGILFHMNLMNSNVLFAPRCLNLNAAVYTNGQIQLGNLIVLWIIRIKIIFPVKFTILVDVTIERQTHGHGIFHNLFIQHRKGTRHTGTYRTGMGVRRTSKCR